MRCLSMSAALIGLVLIGFALSPVAALAQQPLDKPADDGGGAEAARENPFNKSLPIKDFKGNAVPKTPAKRAMTELMIGPVEIAEDEDKLQKLYKERYNTALQDIQARFMEFRVGQGQLIEISESIGRLAESEPALDRDDAQRERFLKKIVDLYQNIEQAVELNHQHGIRTLQEVYQARYHRLEAQIRLMEFQRDRDDR